MLVWIVFLFVPIAYYDKSFNPPEWRYKVLEKFHYLQLVGFVVLVSGVIVFNEIIVIKFWGFDKNLRFKDEKVDRETFRSTYRKTE
jgi:hypothetical protein